MGCPPQVKAALEGLPGVISATVNFKKEEAHVVYKKGETTIKQMIEALKNAGFEGKLNSKIEKNPSKLPQK